MALPMKYATLCYLHKNGKTLLIDYRDYEHAIHKGLFAPPGGKLEFNENKAHCAIREIKEETGILINQLVDKGTIIFLNEKALFGGKPAKANFTVHIFESIDFDDSNAKATEGKIAWIPDDEFLNAPMREGDRKIWELMKEYKQIVAEIEHVGVTLSKVNILSSVKN